MGIKVLNQNYLNNAEFLNFFQKLNYIKYFIQIKLFTVTEFSGLMFMCLSKKGLGDDSCMLHLY